MDDRLILDILLGAIIALFAPIGFWRGAAREAIVSAGALFGATLAAAWARPWGDDLADLVDVRQGGGRIAVAATMLLVSTFVLGYGSGALLIAGQPGRLGRVVGALLASLNGAVLLHYGLDYIERFLAENEDAREVLADSSISWFLLRQFGWLLVGAGVALGLIVVVSLLIGRRGAALPAPVAAAPAYDAADGGARGDRPVRLPRGADAGKYEPSARGFDPATGRYADDAPSAAQTMRLPPVDPWRVSAEGGRAGGERAAEAPELARGLGGPEWATLRGSAATSPTEQGEDAVGANGHDPLGQPRAASRLRTCRVCGGDVSDTDRFCPVCGSDVR